MRRPMPAGDAGASQTPLRRISVPSTLLDQPLGARRWVWCWLVAWEEQPCVKEASPTCSQEQTLRQNAGIIIINIH